MNFIVSFTGVDGYNHLLSFLNTIPTRLTFSCSDEEKEYKFDLQIIKIEVCVDTVITDERTEGRKSLLSLIIY